jgi:hypothetical protein
MKARLLAVIGALVLAAGLAHGADAGRTPKPAIVVEQGEKCVAPAEQMRREHMNMLKHHRDRTVHEGIRTTEHSLKGCVDCHASKKNGAVIGTSENFCQGCHEYASVKLDCWECHTPKARGKIASGNKP